MVNFLLNVRKQRDVEVTWIILNFRCNLKVDYRTLDHHLTITRSYAFNGDIEGTVQRVCAIPSDLHSRISRCKSRRTVKALATKL